LARLKFDTNKALKELKELIMDQIDDYIASVDDLQSIRGVYASSDFSDSSREKPYITIYPTDSEIIESGQCMVEKNLIVEVAVFVAGPSEEQNTLDMISYSDCIESMFTDNSETASLFDIKTTGVEYFSRGSTIEKMARIMIEGITRSESR
jgi:hypothetical protein